jgi:hypothetical protein
MGEIGTVTTPDGFQPESGNRLGGFRFTERILISPDAEL